MADFHWLGTVERYMERAYSRERGSAIQGARRPANQGGTPSAPIALVLDVVRNL